MSDVPRAAGNPAHEKGGFGVTARTDAWWQEWLFVLVGLAILFGYAGVAAFLGQGQWGPYLSPFYSPHFLQLHTGIALIPVGLIPLVVIAGFRMTCYYYRKSYYRAFFQDPPGCAVGEPRSKYEGETKFPFLIQNAHRYFMYLATIALIFLWWDVVQAWVPSLAHHMTSEDVALGIPAVNVSVGSILMLVNVILLSGYTLGCHSLRHLIGGKSNCMSCAPAAAAGWKAATKFNAKHMQWAWASLFSVCATDLYIRLSGMGLLHLEKWTPWVGGR